MQPKLIIQQKLTTFVNRYEVFTALPDGEKGELVAFAQQKRMNIREKIIFYTDESKQAIAFTLRAEKVLDVHGRYFVEDANGVLLGALKKQFKQSLLVSSWQILDPTDTPLFTVAESNKTLAILRRTIGFIPLIGELIDVILQIFLKYHFSFTDTSGKEVGIYRKTTTFRDHYALEMTDEAFAAHDWRVLAAMGVGLDAFQSR